MDEARLGTLIALEDGYGSFAQAELDALAADLQGAGYDVALFDYQQPDSPAGYFVGRYHAGEYGETTQTNPYISILLHAVDYFDAMGNVENLLQSNQIVLASNFASSIMAKEAIKFGTQPERAAFFLWCDQILFDTFGLRRPDKTLVVSGESVEPSAKARILEEMSGVLSRDLKLVDCYRNGRRLPDEETRHLLLETMRDVLPKTESALEAANGLEEIWLPELDPELSDAYQSSMTKMLRLRQQIINDLTANGTNKNQQLLVAELCSPLALETGEASTVLKAPKTTSEVLTNGYSQDLSTCRLDSWQPRQEFDLLTFLLFTSCDLSVPEIESRLTKLTFEKKDALLSGLLKDYSQDGTLVELPVSYNFELITSYSVQEEMRLLLGRTYFQSQPLSPRYGYDMPAFLEEHGLTDRYLDCFDESMNLYNRLEASGQSAVAPYACLRGHQLRWRLSLNLDEVIKLRTARSTSEEARSLINELISRIQERHTGVLTHLSLAGASFEE